MKLLIIMDPGILIPVKGYGGHERLVEMFAREYCKMGHTVELLITSGSSVEGCTVHNFGKEGFPPHKKDAMLAVPVAWKFLWKNRNKYDLIHNFGRLAYLLPVLHLPVKKIMTYGREITSRNINIYNSLGGKNIFFTACSADLLSRVKCKGNWDVVYNAIEFSKYTLQENPDNNAPLVFLGRLEKVKGCHIAITIAKATGCKLIIAGNVSQLPEEKRYFETEIEPFIDGSQIQYIGTVNDAEKNMLLGKAKALLFPIEWNEPFGIVMIEAMACGTPVIAYKRGSVDEVIDEGITGYKVTSLQEMIEAVKKLHTLSRLDCRNKAQARFDVSRIAKHYLSIVDDNRKKVVILSTHQPAANPRALKEYETLKEGGWLIKHLYAYNANWSFKIDEQKFDTARLARQDFVEIGGNPNRHPLRFFVARILHKGFRILAVIIPFFKQMSTAREAFSFWLAAKRYPADLYIAHYLGTLPGAARAARKHKARLIFDAEDFHRGEQSYYTSQMKNVICVENKYFRKTNAITTASPMITKAYKKLYPQLNISTVNNVFSKIFLQRKIAAHDPELKLFWFSQNIGPYRGLEIFIQALHYLEDKNISLTIMGNTRSEHYKNELMALAPVKGKIIFKETVPPEDIFTIASQYDIGLAGEMPDYYNREICLSNKLFTYLLAGNCIVASDMPAQKEFMEVHDGIGLLYKYNDPKDLAAAIILLYNDRGLLSKYSSNACLLAKETLNWEQEKEKWLATITKIIYN